MDFGTEGSGADILSEILTCECRAMMDAVTLDVEYYSMARIVYRFTPLTIEGEHQM